MMMPLWSPSLVKPALVSHFHAASNPFHGSPRLPNTCKYLKQRWIVILSFYWSFQKQHFYVSSEVASFGYSPKPRLRVVPASLRAQLTCCTAFLNHNLSLCASSCFPPTSSYVPKVQSAAGVLSPRSSTSLIIASVEPLEYCDADY